MSEAVLISVQKATTGVCLLACSRQSASQAVIALHPHHLSIVVVRGHSQNRASAGFGDQAAFVFGSLLLEGVND